MSGFAGIIHLDDAPVDATVLGRMAEQIEKHGGDARGTHCGKHFGFSHSLLRTTFESDQEAQPLTFDGQCWIVGDIRIDARRELVNNLMAAGRDANLEQPDIELAFHAWHAWKEKCVNYLCGDFAFITWDSARQKFFACRDCFGIKPLYYCRLGQLLLFSNVIDAIRAHPLVSSSLNEASICDFLAIGYNLDEQQTYFADIHRLPPSHTLSVTAGRQNQLAKYSRLAYEKPLKYKDESEYAEHFLELFSLAVGDRLRCDRVGFELSGGLDSTSCAAMAAQLNQGNHQFAGLGITTDNSHRDPGDEEARYAAMVAKRSGFAHQVLPTAPHEDFYAARDTSQPYAWPFVATLRNYATHIRNHGKVMLTGHGGDPHLHSSGFEVLDRYREQSFPAFATWLLKTAFARRSFRGLGLRTLWNKDTPRIPMSRIPPWLNPRFVEQSGTAHRWKELFYAPQRYPQGCTCELAWDELKMPMWSHIFEDDYHDLFRGIDCRHPLYDLRLVNFMLSVPPPIKRNKKILRLAAERLLPKPLLQRPKSGFEQDLVQNALAGNPKFVANASDLSMNGDWIDRQAYNQHFNQYAAGYGDDLFTIMCPISLALWAKERV